MDILLVRKAAIMCSSPRNVGQQAQFNLGVVRVHQHLARSRHEHFPQLRPQLGAHRDVLEVGFRGGQRPVAVTVF